MEGARRVAQFRRAWHRTTRSPRTWQLWQLPGWLLAYVIAVVVADSIAIGVAAYLWFPGVRAAQLLLFAALLGCVAVTVEMTRSRGEAAGLIKDTYAIWELPAAILLPPVFGLLAPIPRIALTQWRIRQIAPHRRVFSAGVISLSYGAANITFHFLASHLAQVPGIPVVGSGGQVTLWWLLAVVLAGVIAWAVNNLLILPAVKGSDPTVQVRDVIATREGVLNDLAELCAAALVTIAIFFSPFSVLLALPLVIVLQRSSLHSQLVSDLRLDGKTGLLNPGTWRKEASAEVNRACRTRERVAVALIDIDDLKTFNDGYGHLAGDNALAMVAGLSADPSPRMRHRWPLRRGRVRCALPADRRRPCSSGHGAAASPDRQRGNHPGAGSGTRHCTARSRWGWLRFRARPLPLTDILALADSALYHAKNAGRDRVAVMTESEKEMSTSRPE